MWKEYLVFIIFFILSFAISIIIYMISYFSISKEIDIEKISAYECGFDPFEDTRKKFDVRFYLVSILFIIFDLEVVYLFPWSVIIYKIDLFGFVIMCIFLLLVTIGFFYEWMIGALEWE